MASNAEEFVLKLNEQISGAAGVAKSAMAQLEAQIRQEQQALVGLEGNLATASAKLQQLGQGVDGSANIAAFRKQQAAVAALQAQIEKKSSGIGALEGAKGLAQQADAMKKVGGEAVNTESQMHALVSSAQVAGGSFGGLAGRAQQLITGLGKGGVAGAAVLAAAAVAILVVGLISATIATAQWAVALADANRSAKLTNEGMAASSANLANLGSILPGVQASTGLATAEIQRMAESLDKAGVSAADMPGALQAIATATAGGATADFIAKLEAGLKATGKVPPELAAQMSKFAAISAQKMLSLDAQGDTLKRNLAGVFGGLKIDGLLQGLAKLVGLFDANTDSGKALKFLFEQIFQPLIDGAAAALPAIERVFIIALAWAVKAYTALKPYSSELKLLAEIVGGLLVAAFAIVGISILLAFSPLILIVAVVIGAIMAVIAIVEALAAAWDWISGAASAAWDAVTAAVQGAIDWLSGLSLSDIGSAMINGLVAGITGAGGAILGAITGAVGGAIDAAKGLLGIHSPSKVFAQLGMQTGAGFTEGVDKGAPEVQTSMSKLVSPPAAKGGKGGGGKPGHNLEFNNCTFGGGTTREAIREWVLGALDEAGLDGEPAT